MKNIKTFENWKNNIIDHNLFSSGKAKYNPRVVGNTIHYKTGNVEPFYFARVEQKGTKFICKIYRNEDDGKEIRLRNKLKKDLRSAHNYVREFLNQKLKRDAEKARKKAEKNAEKNAEKGVENDNIFKNYNDDSNIQKSIFTDQKPNVFQRPESRSIVRRF